SPIVEMIVTDTIPLREEAKACRKIKVISISSLLADAIRRIYEDESVSCLFV
ncbi:MAG: phosphoribosylpyrophosphate synthetase, partial [Thermodesulfobacteriota bacterium]